MAGVKGRSGGPRPNSGGARPGAGRKPKAPDVLPVDTDPLAFLRSVMCGSISPTGDQLKAAIAAAKYVHRVAGDAGKKEEAAKRADEAAGGKFSPRKAPLKLVNG